MERLLSLRAYRKRRRSDLPLAIFNGKVLENELKRERKKVNNRDFFKLVDIGEGNIVPDDFDREETRLGLAFRNLIAGAIAGAVSRTFTAPFDRLKTVMQVRK